MPGVCPRCNREVYFAEEKLALGKVWHTFCFSCRNCRKLLNSCNVVTHLGELFCKNCYGRQFHSANDHQILPKILLPANPTQNSSRCSCGVESSIGNVLLSRKRHYQSDACRLRGGGSEIGETYVSFEEEKKHFFENECANLSITNSMSTLCDPPPSPTAVTTWYNRQHSKFRSTSSESEKNNITKDCRFEAQQDIDLSELNPPLSNNEIDIADAQLSTDKTRVPSASWNNKINKSAPACEFSANNSIISPRRKFAYPPVPPPRNPLPSRRRVSFCDVVFGDTRGDSPNCMTNMQDVRHRFRCNDDSNEEYRSSYDIWRADDPAGKNDGGYENVNVSQTETEGTGRMHFERSASECCNESEETLNKCNDIEKNPGPSRTMNEKDDESSREDSMTYQNCPSSSNGHDDSERMRGGCGGSCSPCGPRPKVSCGVVKVIETACHCGKSNSYDFTANTIPDRKYSKTKNIIVCTDVDQNHTLYPRSPIEIRHKCHSLGEPELCCTVPSCSSCSSPCNERPSCCPPANQRPICKKPIIRCRPVCTETQGCGGGGCCGGGCRGGCGKPGQTCMPARPCSTPCRPCSPCSPPRSCPPQSSCSCRKCSPCCSSIGGGANCCGRSKSPTCRVSRRRCSTDRDCNEGGCCRPKVTCECLGGGLDCQRCGRKVYQAEMQMVSGIPYHNICFSCYCCRKPLEPLTYQENCGEIYCKQCYVRNFGPQGYGYGAGPGTLQTPM